MKKKHSLKIFLYAVLGGTILASGCAISAFSFAWFSNNNNVSRGFDGSTTGAYFARGNGSEGNPYVINKPIHLYNLAWLQYVGFFKDKEPYFIIERDLDMSGWTLPPIGTTKNPFLGHLDGNDTLHSQGQGSTAKISNLTISNSFEKYNGRHPSSQTSSTYVSPEITGLFGVVGDKKSTIEPSVKNLYLNKISIDSATDNALSGVVAGYVNGALSNILINDSSLNLKDDTNKLTGYDSISKYTSVGYCEPNYRTTYVKNNTTMYEPRYVGNASFNPTSGSGGEEQGWGGSIDISSLSKRITYIANNSTETKDPGGNKNTRRYVSSLFNSVIFTTMNSKKPGFSWDVEETQTASFEDGTVLPLNIDLKKATIKNFDSSEQLGSFYGKGEAEPVLSGNTGYIVGTKMTTNAIPRLRHQRTNQKDSSLGIQHSIFQQETNATISDRKLFDNSGNFSLFYCDSVSSETKTYRIVDENNSKTAFTYSNDQANRKTVSELKLSSRYSEVKAEFINMLNDGTTDSQISSGYINLNGLLFNKIKEADIKPNNGSNLFKGGINFSTSSSGILTTVAGTFSDIKDNHCFYDLYTIDKPSNTKKRIFKVYFSEKKNDSKYTFSSSETVKESGYELKIDLEKMRSQQSLYPRCAYYIEIPLNKGDYFLTSLGEAPSSNFPYILYLDIGANAGGTAGRKVDRTKVYELLEQINEGFTYPTGVAIVDFDNAVNDVKKLTITIGSTYSGSVTFNYSGNDNAQINVDASNSDTGLAYFDENMRINNGTITDSQVHGTITNTETQRLTYFDYDKETKITNVLTFSQTRESFSSAWSETKREDYQSGESNTTFVGVGNLTIYGDDGKSTTDLPELVYYGQIKKDTNVFKLKMLTPLESPLEVNWLPLGKIETKEDAANYYFTLKGYDFTLKKGAEALARSDYSITKNAEYALSINGTTIKS